MSEVQSGRPPAHRGRGSSRGGRGGYSSRAGRGGSRNAKNDNQENVPPPSLEDEGEIGQLKKKHSTKITTIKELFPDWTDEDIVYALESTDGNLESTIERITEGSISQWGEVKKKSDRSRSKAKEPTSNQTESTGPSGRGGRSRGGIEGRGRGRGPRGGRGASQANGTRSSDKQASGSANDGWDNPPPYTSGAWDNATPSADAGESANAQPSTSWDQPTNGDARADAGWGSSEASKEESTEASKEAKVEPPKNSLIPEGSKKSWASILAKPPPAPVAKKIMPPVPEKPVEPIVDESPPEPTLPPVDQPLADEAVIQTPEVPPSDLATALAPSKDELTETNLEQLPDTSIPPATATAASTVASTQDPHNNLNSATSLSRPAVSGFATTAYKAAGGSTRSSSFPRRVMEQQEAVVMPGTNHAVDRAAVQFGSMGLNGSTEDLDVDDEREEAETRTQPPQHSPNAPRASLPPAPQATHAPVEDVTTHATRPAPGLPPVPQQSSPPQQATQIGMQYNQFGRYGETAQKPYDPFGQQASQPQTQAPSQEAYPSQPQTQPQQPVSSASTDYSSFYTADPPRNTYPYYGGYGQQSQETGAAQPRTGSGFGTTGPESQPQYATSQPQARYGQAEAQGSGHNTPNLAIPGHQPQHSQQHMPQGQQAAGFPYAHPYYSSPYYANYMSQANQHQYGRNRPMFDDARRYEEGYMQHNNQYAYSTGQGYGTPYGKQGMYGQPQHNYGSYDHSSSPANAGSFNQQGIPGRDANYGRTGSAQPSESQQAAGSTAFGSMPDVFGRSSSGFGQQPLALQHSGQQAGSEDAAKGYDASKAGGPSPSLGQAANRPGSANNMPGQPQGQSGLPPTQTQQGNQQQAFGGYPSHVGHQYGAGAGGLGGHQGAAGQNHHQSSGYGNYGGAGFGNYYGNSGRGGWSGYSGH